MALFQHPLYTVILRYLGIPPVTIVQSEAKPEMVWCFKLKVGIVYDNTFKMNSFASFSAICIDEQSSNDQYGARSDPAGETVSSDV